MQSSSPLVTFIVPCYNYARYLPECLDSIFGQTMEVDFEVILVDDASTDDTQAVFSRYVSDARVRVFTHAKNKGHARTMNEALAEARGTYVARIDPDDRYRLDFLATTLPKFEAHPEVGLVYGDAALIDAIGTITAERSDVIHGGADFCGNELVQLLEQNFICAPTVIARREAWVAAAPVPEWLAFNDWYFTVMMARQHAFCYVNRVLADYRVHSQNHHRMVVRKKIEEPSIVWLLDKVFASQEVDPVVDAAKRRARRRVYGAHYRDFADKYFGVGHNEDARRCYMLAFCYRPAYLMDAGLFRRFLGTLLGQARYERLKALALHRSSH